MSDRPRLNPFLYWSVYLFLMLIGILLRRYHILPIKNTSIFLLGLMWIWTGLSLFGSINPYFAQKYGRKQQLVFAAASVGLGVAWSIVSLSPLSNQALPMAIISLPFLIADFILFLRRR